MQNLASFAPQGYGDIPDFLLIMLVIGLIIVKCWPILLLVVVGVIVCVSVNASLRKHDQERARPAGPPRVKVVRPALGSRPSWWMWRPGSGLLGNAALILGALSVADLFVAYGSLLQPRAERLASPLVLAMPSILTGFLALICLLVAMLRGRISRVASTASIALLTIASASLWGLILSNP